jgi:hypothetical protein
MKSLTDIVNTAQNALTKGIKVAGRSLLIPAAAAGLALGTANKAEAGPVQVGYTPTQVSTVNSPIFGLGDTSSEYFLMSTYGTGSINKNFAGNGQDVPRFTNPSSAQDAASHQQPVYVPA